MLRQLLGEHADLAWTHFLASRVAVVVSASSWSMDNGRICAELVANMLTRFVGNLDVALPRCVEQAAVDRLATHLRSIDSRPGKVIRVMHDDALADEVYAATLIIGADGHKPPGQAIWVGFSGWRAWLSRVAAPARSIAADIPIGALVAGCFAVAEVFKTLAATSAEGSVRERLLGRLENTVHYSAWTAEWVNAPLDAPPTDAEPVRALRPTGVEGVLQVGAGAVGNGSAIAFSRIPKAGGTIRLVDPKAVTDKNLNRCVLFLESDVGASKVSAVVGKLTKGTPSWTPEARDFRSEDGNQARIIVSTVDNNEVRHAMQESLPQWLVQGSTNGTQVCVSVHRPLGELSCLVCRHPDPTEGLVRRDALSVTETAHRLGIDSSVITESVFADSRSISEDFLSHLRSVAPDAADFFEEARSENRDLCGAIGDFRQSLGVTSAPEEPAVPFASVFGGVQAAAEAFKVLQVLEGIPAPVLRNVLQLDLAMRYTRAPLSFAEPPRTNCQLCQARQRMVVRVYRQRWGGGSGDPQW